MRKLKRQRTLRDSLAIDEPSANTLVSPDDDLDAGPGFLVVGVGASAGGLEALKAFFSGIPTDTSVGMAFVIVQHLAPDHCSILTDLIQRYTSMHAAEVEEGLAIQPDHVYIIPPNCDIALMNGTFQLLEPALPRGLRLPVDFFFRSLAQEQRQRAVGIVLSGTGSDGTQGVRAIKGAGGMVMAQALTSAEYDGMPRSAISTGLVDYELPPAEMPAQLIAYVSRAFEKRVFSGDTAPGGEESALKKIHVLLRDCTGHDFSGYKPSGVNRRIARRLAVNQIDTIDDYVKFALRTPGEVEALFRDLLIGVSNFFRDAKAFEILETEVMPAIFSAKPAGSTIRIWSPGCSTGEEAYSLAILAQERAEALRQGHKVLVFATDIDSQGIAVARSGLYPGSIAEDISSDRLARFFTGDIHSGYRVNKTIRDLVVFSEQDVTRDPPFSRLDLVSCRNVLIYMGTTLQRRLLLLFHYAIVPGGFLFLGNSEGIGDFNDLFALVDRKARLYRSKADFRGPRRGLPSGFDSPGTLMSALPLKPTQKTTGTGKLALRELIEQLLLDELGPTGALVDSKGDILYLHGRTGLYLEPAPGETGASNIVKMAREGLLHDMATALRKAVSTNETVCHPRVRVKTNGGYTLVDLIVRPVAVPAATGELADATESGDTTHYLVILARPTTDDQRVTPGADGSLDTGEPADPDADVQARIDALRHELRTKGEYLRITNEELETSNEELQSTNEEMLSLNEELQSANEELETAKEELQSINEELATVNAELQVKVGDLTLVNNDMNNLLAGTGIGTVFVDNELNIVRFTPAATRAVNLMPSDVGRPVGHITSNLVGYGDVVADTKLVLDTLIPKELEVQVRDGAWYAMRIQPYRTLTNVIEGGVITFVDITEAKLARLELEKMRVAQRLAVVVRDTRDALLVVSVSGRVLAWNPAAERLYGWTEAEALAMNATDLVPEDDRAEMMAALRTLAEAKTLTTTRTRRLTKSGGALEVDMSVTALLDASDAIYAMATVERATIAHRSGHE